jgi:hypothetical protein
MRGRARSAVVLVLVCSLGARAARSQEPLRDDPRARQFFEVGAQAYSKGQYLLAAEAFEQAFALTNRPGLLFSLAQAHQRQFRATGDESHLRLAVEHFRKYLARVDRGGRRADAERALNSLLLMAERLNPKTQDTSVQRTGLARLLLSSSTPEARITVNGDPVESLPTAIDLPEGRYRVLATAPGFESRAQEVALVAGTSVALNFELRPLPAVLRVDGPAGAELLIDGVMKGWLPMRPLALPAGNHSVSMRKPGAKTKTVLARLERGAEARVRLALESTTQRDAAWVFLGGALAAGAAAGTFAVLAVTRDRGAQTLEKRRQSGQLSLAEGQELNRDVAARDRLRTLAVAGAVTTGALLGAGALLYWLDTPEAPEHADTARSARPKSRFTIVPVVGSKWGFGASTAF